LVAEAKRQRRPAAYLCYALAEIETMKDQDAEKEIVEKGLNAPRVTLEGLHKKITDVEIVKHVTKTGQTLRWAVLTMENGFAVVGKPSCSVSPENDNAELGEKIAIDNSQCQVWELEGYALKQKLHDAKS
jgi:hypothetical protein